MLKDGGCWWLKTVINISKLSPTHFVSNIRHRHRYNLLRGFEILCILFETFSKIIRQIILKDNFCEIKQKFLIKRSHQNAACRINDIIRAEAFL